jgi:type VI secretion system secreted protein VgrG
MPIPADECVRFQSPFDDQLLFHHMEGEEELGHPFRYDLTLLSKKGDLVLADLLGQLVTVELDFPDLTPTPNDTTRYFNGYVTRFSRQGVSNDYHVYSATVRPWLWLLSQTSTCRVFQNKTVPQIIKEVFRAHGLTDFHESLTGDYAPREFVVQYRETDFNFVCRLMEHEGIYYYFTHEAKKHTLVLADAYGAHQKVPGYEKVPYIKPATMQGALPPLIDGWQIGNQTRSGTVVLKDFNFQTPKANLRVSRSAPNPHQESDFEDYAYPGDYQVSNDGEAYARLRMEELNARYEQARGMGTAEGLAVGSLFELTGYPVVSDNREYLITAATYTINGVDYESQASLSDSELFRCTFSAIDSHCPFRTERRTVRPTVAGPQTATVVGDKGEDITTDKYGRVKVKFHWDRQDEKNGGNGDSQTAQPADKDKNGNDPNSSCWVRVAQMWAGTKFGAINIPRIGDEVIVDFLEGDPDRPIITGRVYNADHMPPYTLPDNKTQTGIKTRSTKAGNPDNFNELRFEDKKGKEELHIQAERDMSTYVKRNQSTRVDGDRSVSVGGNQSTTVTKNETQTYQAERSMTVAKTNKDEITGAHTGIYHAGRTETVEKGDTLTVKDSNKTVDVIGAYDITVKDHLKVTKASTSMTIDDNFVVDASGKVDMHNPGTSVVGEGTTLTLNGNSAVTITCGASSISMKSDGTIEITGKTVKIGNATNNAAFDPQGTTINGVKITSAAVGIQEISGALIKVG